MAAMAAYFALIFPTLVQIPMRVFASILHDRMCQLLAKIHIDQTAWTMSLEIPTMFVVKYHQHSMPH